MKRDLTPKEARRLKKNGIAIVNMPLPLSRRFLKTYASHAVIYKLIIKNEGSKYEKILIIGKPQKDGGTYARMVELLKKEFPQLKPREYIFSYLPIPGASYVAANKLLQK